MARGNRAARMGGQEPAHQSNLLSILQISRPSLPSPLWLVRASGYSTSKAPSRQMDLKYWRDE
jgi:hypothetical protein